MAKTVPEQMNLHYDRCHSTDHTIGRSHPLQKISEVCSSRYEVGSFQNRRRSPLYRIFFVQDIAIYRLVQVRP